MPKVNDIEATRRIKQFCPSSAVLALTAYDYDQHVFALLEASAAGYLLKDVSGSELMDAIRAVHRGDSVLHPTIARKVLKQFKQLAVKPGKEQARLLGGSLTVQSEPSKGTTVVIEAPI